MITILKLASVSAFLSAGVVTAYEAPRAPVGSSGKIYVDRLPAEAASIVVADASTMTGGLTASDARPVAASSDCRAQAWPYKSQDCVEGASVRRAVRTITIERRDVPNTSTLVRVPAAIASN